MYNLGEGLTLRRIEVENNNIDYCYLYKDGIKISDQVYRRGGVGGQFKDGYCIIISYSSLKDGGGNFVIIDKEGKIIFEAPSYHYPYHLGGVVCKLDDYYYNLLNGEMIMLGNTSIRGKNYLIVEHKYISNYHKIQIESGIYQIELKTGKVAKIDEV